MRKFLAALVAVFLLPLTVQAHTTEELADWYQEWLATPAPSNWKIAELVDMQSRHSCFPVACEPAAVPISSTGSSAPGTAANSGMGSDVEQWRTKVGYYFPADQVDRALAVMKCESGGNPWADNPRSSATGLMQILASTWGPRFGYTTAELFDPDINLYVASLLYYDGGWNHWNASRHCWG